MSRRTRPNLRGAFFHVTSRIQGKAPLFTPPLRTRIVDMIREAAAGSDASVIAYCVMPNHLHLLVRQGSEPLHRYMQPLLRRVALAVQRTHSLEGHVVERPYRARVCMDAEDVRRVIAYIHRNPVRAGLCDDCDAFEWSSHHCYVSAASIESAIKDEVGLMLFASGAPCAREVVVREYLEFLAWRDHVDRIEQLTGLDLPLSLRRERPCTHAGDRYWRDRLMQSGGGPDELSCSWPAESAVVRPDLRDLALRVLGTASMDAELLQLVRSRYGGPPVVRVREGIIAKASMYGYRGVEIARYLRVSPATVSRVMRAVRVPFVAA